MNEYYNALSRKLVMTVIIVSFTPLFLVSALILNQFNKSYREKVKAHLEVSVFQSVTALSEKWAAI